MARIWVKTAVSPPQNGYGQWERHSVADQLVKGAGGTSFRELFLSERNEVPERPYKPETAYQRGRYS